LVTAVSVASGDYLVDRRTPELAELLEPAAVKISETVFVEAEQANPFSCPLRFRPEDFRFSILDFGFPDH